MKLSEFFTVRRLLPKVAAVALAVGFAMPAEARDETRRAGARARQDSP